MAIFALSTYEGGNLDGVGQRPEAARVERFEVEDVNALHAAQELVALKTCRLLFVGGDGLDVLLSRTVDLGLHGVVLVSGEATRRDAERAESVGGPCGGRWAECAQGGGAEHGCRRRR